MSEHFSSLQRKLQIKFKKTLSDIKNIHSQLLYSGSILAITSMLFLILVTLSISLSTRKSIYLMIDRAKQLAQGSTDFSKRIQRDNNDELGKLVYWFNQLSNKLEHDYLQIKKVSITDKLTQLNNRNRTDQYLPQAILEELAKDHTALYVVIIDIDHFKQINDKYGHLTGDHVLKDFASILKDHALTSDYISRWGGEEFLLVWHHLDHNAATLKAENLRVAIEQYVFPEVGHVTASIGISQLNKTDSMQSVIKRADHNLYHAKEGGRNQIVLGN